VGDNLGVDFSVLHDVSHYRNLDRLYPKREKIKRKLAEREKTLFNFLCVLAYHLLVAIERCFLERGIHTSWWTIRQELSTHQLVTVVLLTDNGKVLRIHKAN
jgi:hypothetical protein